MYEWIGILGSVTIILAFLLKGELKIRIVDLIGAALFVIYGVLIKSFSTVLLNGVLVVVQLIYIFKGEINNERNHSRRRSKRNKSSDIS